MNYLVAYGISEEQIKDIEKVIDDNKLNKDLFLYDFEKIIEILNMFKAIGVNNFYDIMIASPSLFCDTPKSIKKRIASYGDTKELAKLINEDVSNLALVDLI